MDGCCYAVMLNQSGCWGGYGWHDFLPCLFPMLYLLFRQYVSAKYYIGHPSKTKPNRVAFHKICLAVTDQINFRKSKCYVRIFIWSNLFFPGNEKPIALETVFSLGFLHSWDWGYCQQSWQETGSEIFVSASFQLHKLSESEWISSSRSLWSLQANDFSFEFLFPHQFVARKKVEGRS